MDETDPRVTGEHVRQLGEPAALTLVGVVHDHPASAHRVRRVIDRVDPDVVALELPPLSIPLFELYAEDDRTPPAFGGEMSAAIQAADARRVVGIDRPTPAYLTRLSRKLREGDFGASIVADVVRNTLSAAKHAVVCRVTAALTARTPIRMEVDDPVAHGVDGTDAPATQAADERARIRQSRTFMNAFRNAGPSRASRIEDSVREEHMLERLSALDAPGGVVAVVGVAHLDPIAEAVGAERPSETADSTEN